MGKKTSVVDDIKAVVRRSMGRFIPSELLESVASRIEDEYVELPVDKDGAIIRVGDTVYHETGEERKVTRMDLYGDRWRLLLSGWRDCYHANPEDVSHERPDSLERIADELDKWRVCAADKCDMFGIEEDSLFEFADRIRKLAKEASDD